jgi:hypothetical protein
MNIATTAMRSDRIAPAIIGNGYLFATFKKSTKKTI